MQRQKELSISKQRGGVVGKQKGGVGKSKTEEQQVGVNGGMHPTTLVTPTRKPPVPTTVEEDIEAEIREERMYALDTAMETLTTEAAELITDPRRLEKSLPLKDIKREETRRLREHQLKIIEQNRTKAKKKFDLVEDMFQRALERRYRAHLKIAADPPADRLVGKSMLQYVPAAVLHQQPEQTDVFLQVQTEEDLQRFEGQIGPTGLLPPALNHPVPLLSGTTSKKAIEGLTEVPTAGKKEEEGKNAIVFLTEMDGPDATKQDRAMARGGALPGLQEPTREEAGEDDEGLIRASPSQLDMNKEIDEALRQEAALSPAERRRKRRADLDALYQVPEDRLKEWRELGYDVVYVAHRDPVRGRRIPRKALPNTTGRTPMSSSNATGVGVGPSSSLQPSPGTAPARGGSGTRLSSRPAVGSGGGTRTGSGSGARPPTAEDADGGIMEQPRYISSRERDRRSEMVWPECSWMKLAPLPPVCLLQKRLAAEDMALEELLAESRRYQRFKSSVSIPNTKKGSRKGNISTNKTTGGSGGGEGKPLPDK